MRGRECIGNTIKLAKNLMEKKGKKLTCRRQANRSMSVIYRPVLVVSQLLNPKEAQEHQQFVETMRWIIELGRFDIIYEVSLLSSYLTMPRKGHMEALMGIFANFDKSFGKTIIVNPKISKISQVILPCQEKGI